MSGRPQPGRLLGTGRNTEVFDLGDGRVLRRHRGPRSDAEPVQRMVRTLGYAYEHGLPVPRVLDVDGADFVMAKVAGPTMAELLVRRESTMEEQARVLAQLHDRVHAVPPPDWLDAPFGRGAAFLHLDVHPLNVIAGEAGPVLLDWENAARGPAPVDEIVTWVLLRFMTAAGWGPKAVVARAGQGVFARSYRRGHGAAWTADDETAAVTWKLQDPNLFEGERARLHRYLRRRDARARR